MGSGGNSMDGERPSTAFSDYVDRQRKAKVQGEPSQEFNPSIQRPFKPNRAAGEDDFISLVKSRSQMAGGLPPLSSAREPWRPPSRDMRASGQGGGRPPTAPKLTGISGSSMNLPGGKSTSTELAAAAQSLAKAADKLAASMGKGGGASKAALGAVQDALKGRPLSRDGANNAPTQRTENKVIDSRPPTAPGQLSRPKFPAPMFVPPHQEAPPAVPTGMYPGKPPRTPSLGPSVQRPPSRSREDGAGGPGAPTKPLNAGPSPSPELFADIQAKAAAKVIRPPTAEILPGQERYREASKRLDTGERPMSVEDRFRMVYEVPGRHSRINPVSEEADRANRFNEAVRRLKEKIYIKGTFAITQHFQGLDADNSGVLEKSEFMEALKLFNLGDCVTDDVANMLLAQVDRDNSGTVDYAEFTEALRMGRVPYMPEHGRRRHGPDPDLPFGDPRYATPFAIMKDADHNLEAFDKRVNTLYQELEGVFESFDDDNSGEIDRREFFKAMTIMNEKQNLQLSKHDINELFKQADADMSGSISYAEFVKSFAGGAGKRFIPEFLKPKIARRSQAGNPWDWNAENPNDKFIMKVGSTNNYFGQQMIRRRRRELD